METLEAVEKDPAASASTGTAEAPAVAARPTRSNSAQIALEPTALSNRLETMLLGNHPVPAPSNEVSVASEVSNGIILAAKAAVDALFSSPQRNALMALGLRDLKKAALAYLVWDLRGVLAGARHGQAVAYGKRLQTHATVVEKEAGLCRRRKGDGAEAALLAAVQDALQDVPTPEADSEPDPELTPSAETSLRRRLLEIFYWDGSDCEWERYTALIEQSADSQLAEWGMESDDYVKALGSDEPHDGLFMSTLRNMYYAAQYEEELRGCWRARRALNSQLDESLRESLRNALAACHELCDAHREIESLREALAASRRAWPHVGGGRA